MDDIRTRLADFIRRLELHAATLKRLDEQDRAALENYKFTTKRQRPQKSTIQAETREFTAVYVIFAIILLIWLMFLPKFKILKNGRKIEWLYRKLGCRHVSAYRDTNK